VRKLVARMFGRMPHMNLNPDEAIALGAAVQGGLKMRDVALREVVMTDICPYTLGMEISERLENGSALHGHYLPIIERNTVVPVSREQTVFTMADNQTHVEIRIFQGESRLVKDNVFLGALDIPVPPRKRGEVQIAVRFTYDINGLLEAEMTVQATGQQHRLVIEENPGVLTPAQIERRLAALASLKVHPREDLVNTTLMARAERLYEESLGERRSYVAQLLAAFEQALASQDGRRIGELRGEIEARLNELEGAPWL
jgi:molecular chaperone HscC